MTLKLSIKTREV